ncbi:DNA polymerase III subunit beta [bacterium]|nr:DNA polymerase III subunit beta [bacterium]
MNLSVTISKPLLNLAIQRVQGAITERSLAHIGLRADGSHLHVTAADRMLAVFSKFPVEVKGQGVVFLPAKIFSDVVRELPDGNVSLETADKQLRITAGERNEFMMKIPLVEEALWRDPPSFDSSNTTELPAAKLVYMIEQVQFCVSHDSPRNYGTVGYLHRPGKGAGIRLVGSDGFRLSYCEVELPLPDEFLANGVCLSKKALGEVVRLGSEGFDRIRLSISHDQTTLLAEVPDYQVFVRLSAVKYPKYAGVIPDNKNPKVLVSRNQLQHVAKRVLLAADKSRALQLSFSESSLTLSSRTMGSSESKETVRLDEFFGPKCDMVVNGKFLAEIFSTTPSDKVTLQFKDAEDPIVVVPREEPTDCKSKHILVPIRETRGN